MPSFLSYWTVLADALGDQIPTFRATSTSVSATKEREIISSALIDSSVGADRYKDAFVYGLGTGSSTVLAGQQRVIRQGGFDKATGTLSVTRDFASAPASGHDWALLERYPVIRQDKQPGLRDFINHALREIAVTDFITISTVADQVNYSLPTTTNWWIADAGRIVDIWTVPADAKEKARNEDNIERIHIDGETPILVLRRAYGATPASFQLEVRRPANSRLKQSGTWTDQASPIAGLAADADEAMPSITDVVTVALCHAYRNILEQPSLAERRGYWETKLRDQQNAAALIKFARQAPVEPYRLTLSGGADIGAFR